jgi:uncharacterized protein RhaS with RHS repeats
MYNPIVGRWMEEDPIDFTAGDSDKYRYAGNNPTNAIDPSGLADQYTLTFRSPKDNRGIVCPSQDSSVHSFTPSFGG